MPGIILSQNEIKVFLYFLVCKYLGKEFLKKKKIHSFRIKKNYLNHMMYIINFFLFWIDLTILGWWETFKNFSSSTPVSVIPGYMIRVVTPKSTEV